MICFITIVKIYFFTVLLPFSTEAVGFKSEPGFHCNDVCHGGISILTACVKLSRNPKTHQTLFKALGSFSIICVKRLKGTSQRLSQPETECPEITLLWGI